VHGERQGVVVAHQPQSGKTAVRAVVVADLRGGAAYRRGMGGTTIM
jgi:hypothetical protein